MPRTAPTEGAADVGNVNWLDRAIEDLTEVVQDPAVADELVHLAEHELRHPPQPATDPDEGHAEPPWSWRRGISRERRMLERQGRIDLVGPDHASGAWNYCLLYRPRGPAEVVRALGRHGYVVGRVVSLQQMTPTAQAIAYNAFAPSETKPSLVPQQRETEPPSLPVQKGRRGFWPGRGRS